MTKPTCYRILVTIAITDPDTVEAYADVDDALVFEDLRDGSLMKMAELVARKNAERQGRREATYHARGAGATD
jgi:hypothetical protein